MWNYQNGYAQSDIKEMAHAQEKIRAILQRSNLTDIEKSQLYKYIKVYVKIEQRKWR